MMRFPDRMTLKQLRELEECNPQMPQYIHRLTCSSYDGFLKTLYIEIDTIAHRLAKDRNTLQKHSENALNADICRQLQCVGYSAHHDKNSGGHTDISIEFATYTWIGEGKKVSSVNNNHLKNGYDQLVHRYISGMAGATHAGLLIYCFAPDASHVMTKWREHLEECEIITSGYAKNMQVSAENVNFAMFSDHHHQSSGAMLTIKHIAIPLYWVPPK